MREKSEGLGGTPSVPGVEGAARVLRTLRKAERAILAAYSWMPYPSDIEAQGPARELNHALGAVDEGLREVRKLKDEFEKSILDEVTA